MGWWGMDSSTPDSLKEYRTGFIERFLLKEDPETTVVNVDCHI